MEMTAAAASVACLNDTMMKAYGENIHVQDLTLFQLGEFMRVGYLWKM
jgi:hypothetical protein